MIEAGRSQLGDFLGQLIGQRVAVLEAWRVIQGAQLLGHGLLNFFAVVPSATGPQAGQAVEYATALVIDEVIAIGADDQTRIALEVAVGGKRHPVRIQLELAGQGRDFDLRHVHGGLGVGD